MALLNSIDLLLKAVEVVEDGDKCKFRCSESDRIPISPRVRECVRCGYQHNNGTPSSISSSIV